MKLIKILNLKIIIIMSNIKFYKINKIKLQTKILKITRNAYNNLTKAKIYRCLIGK